MMSKIKSLTVKAFRGIRDTTLDFDSKSIILCGENGFGKSSLVDALEYLFKGSVSPLENNQATSTKRHAPHIDFKPEDVSVSLVVQNPDAVLTRTFNRTDFGGNKIVNLWQLGQHANFILRRQQLLDFIMSTPSGRYARIAQIIGVKELEAIEINLKRKRDELVSSNVIIASRQRTATDDIKTLLDLTTLTPESMLNGINQKLLGWGQKTIKDVEEISGARAKIVKISVEPERIEKAAHLKDIIAKLSTTADTNDLLNRLVELRDACDDLHRDTELIETLVFRDVLQKGKNLIEEFRPDLCPICEQEISSDTLIDRLSERLELMAEVGKKSEVIAQLQFQLSENLNSTVELLRNLWKSVGDLKQGIDNKPIQVYGTYLRHLLDEVARKEIVKLQVAVLDDIARGEELAAWETDSFELRQRLEIEISNLNVSYDDEQIVEAIDFLSRVRQLSGEIGKLERQHKLREWSIQQMTFAYESFAETKKQKIQSIYDSIQEDVQRYYDVLHPGEQHRKIKIRIDTSKRSSTEIKMGFYKRDNEDPRAYQSEGHLDTLGLCTFLAFVKHFNQDFPLIILDDVVSTVDTQHRRRVCELLYKEFSEFQLFITTHDYVWFEELANYQRAYNIGSKFNNIRIIDWSIREGIRLDRYKTRWEVLEVALENGDKVAAGAHGRRNLEWILLQMAINTETKMPLRLTGRYEVAELYDAVKTRFRKLVPEKFEENQHIFTQLEADLIGNRLVHYNEVMENAAIDEVRAFVDSVRALYNLFTCERGQFLHYHRDAEVMKCQCGHIKWNTT
ncbi:MAG: AAA family ATPase [Chloroflexota bacterium]